MPIILVPAYGRDYPTAQAAKDAWQTGSDFKLEGGPYTSERDTDFLRNQYGSISIRWAPSQYVNV